MKNLIQLKLNMDLKGYKKGNIICVETSEDGIPLNVFWRSRLLDGCVCEYKTDTVRQPKENFKKHFKKEDIKDDNI